MSKVCKNVTDGEKRPKYEVVRADQVRAGDTIRWCGDEYEVRNAIAMSKCIVIETNQNGAMYFNPNDLAERKIGPLSVPAEDYEMVRADELQVGDEFRYGTGNYTITEAISTSNPHRVLIRVGNDGEVRFCPGDKLCRTKRATAADTVDDALRHAFAPNDRQPKQIDDWPGPPCRHCGAGTYVGLLGVECKNRCKE